MLKTYLTFLFLLIVWIVKKKEYIVESVAEKKNQMKIYLHSHFLLNFHGWRTKTLILKF